MRALAVLLLATSASASIPITNTAYAPPVCRNEVVAHSTDAGQIEASYASNSNCQWLIETGKDTVTIDFTAFEMEMGYDFVRIYDGNSATPSALLSMLTGKNIPEAITAASGTMLIVLSADATVTASGFSLGWTSSVAVAPIVHDATHLAASDPCSGHIEINNAAGTVSDGPANYLNNARCTWSIESKAGRYVTLSFSALDFEDQYDYLRVYDDFDSVTRAGAGILLGSFTGRNVPSSITSTTGKMFIALTADTSVVSSGFVANYLTSSSAPVISAPAAQVNTGSSWVAPIAAPAANGGACAGTVTLATAVGSFESGRAMGSNLYADNAECQWDIVPAGNARSISLTFDSFATEYVYDHVQVYDGDRLIGQYSGFDNPGTLEATSGRMSVIFDSDGSVEHGGFAASYTSIQSTGMQNGLALATAAPTAPAAAGSAQSHWGSACTHTQLLVQPQGAISTGNNYLDNANCKWHIRAHPGAQVQLGFSGFAMEDFYDWVWVYDGSSSSAPLIGKYSGSTLPPLLTAASGSMFIVLTSDSSIHLAGFSATYSVMNAQDVASRRIQPVP